MLRKSQKWGKIWESEGKWKDGKEIRPDDENGKRMKTSSWEWKD
jgi:hypothetical protein